MTLTLARAAEVSGRSRSTLLRAIRKGVISASRDEMGGFLVEEAELARVYSPNTTDAANGEAVASLDVALAKLDAAETRLADAHQAIDDLRRRLDRADEERRQASDRLAVAQERIAALLTDQRPGAPDSQPATRRRRWWPFR